MDERVSDLQERPFKVSVRFGKKKHDFLKLSSNIFNPRNNHRHLFVLLQVSFNMDYYPSATLIHGPVWKNPLQLLPVASVLEENYPVIREELEAILKARPGGT